jgi:hypothetical protein
MKIHIKRKGFIALGMAHGLKRLEADCTDQGASILRHACKCYALPNAQEINHWQKEISAFLSTFSYRTSAKAKSQNVYKWLWQRDIQQWYEAACGLLGETNTLPYEVIKTDLLNFLGEVANAITANANSKAPIDFTAKYVKQMMKLGE